MTLQTPHHQSTYYTSPHDRPPIFPMRYILNLPPAGIYLNPTLSTDWLQKKYIHGCLGVIVQKNKVSPRTQKQKPERTFLAVRCGTVKQRIPGSCAVWMLFLSVWLKVSLWSDAGWYDRYAYSQKFDKKDKCLLRTHNYIAYI